ncbi:MAG: type II toxin-antitoxin system Phd/YefM family antitoxin [Candidatus Riflebacteria bacterium]|nr:type II toxin-antitoxin system Phd/YefM family antitoxin [Candidatus Riflebacteria bacterium]
MARRVSAAFAKAHLSSLTARVAHGGEFFLIERRGKPLAALVGVGELERLEQGRATSARPLGALALTGAWDEVDEAELETVIQEVYRVRASDTGRAVDLGAHVPAGHRHSQ